MAEQPPSMDVAEQPFSMDVEDMEQPKMSDNSAYKLLQACQLSRFYCETQGFFGCLSQYVHI